MNNLTKLTFIATLILLPLGGYAQTEERSDSDSLKLAALEALITAPPERAMPLVSKVLVGDHSTEVKERALFILSQIDSSEAHATLLELANEDGGELQAEAIRMIGISGDPEALAGLAGIYRAGGPEARESVLEAYMIADDKAAILEIAANAENDDDFSAAVEILGAMGARDELRQLSGRKGTSASLIHAYAVSGDFESLRTIALDDSDTGLQSKAIEALGIVGGDEVDATLMEIYRSSDSERIRSAALQGMLISGNDSGVLELYRSSDDSAEKREMLQHLVMMDSDAVWEIIDSALAGDE